MAVVAEGIVAGDRDPLNDRVRDQFFQPITKVAINSCIDIYIEYIDHFADNLLRIDKIKGCDSEAYCDYSTLIGENGEFSFENPRGYHWEYRLQAELDTAVCYLIYMSITRGMDGVEIARMELLNHARSEYMFSTDWTDIFYALNGWSGEFAEVHGGAFCTISRIAYGYLPIVERSLEIGYRKERE